MPQGDAAEPRQPRTKQRARPAGIATPQSEPPKRRPSRAAAEAAPELEAQIKRASEPAAPPGKRAGRRQTSDMLGNIAGGATRIVQKAASILEEEIAAGIVAAKQVEERFVNVEQLRAGKPEETILRFRRDSHEVVDILLDIVTVVTKSLGELTQRAVTIRTGDTPGPQPSEGGRVPTLQVPQTVPAGGTASVEMSMENSGEKETGEFRFVSSDLVSATGDRVACDQVLFSPAVLNIPPSRSEQIVVTVAVPQGTPTGTYAGLLQATKMTRLRAVIVVHVD